MHKNNNDIKYMKFKLEDYRNQIQELNSYYKGTTQQNIELLEQARQHNLDMENLRIRIEVLKKENLNLIRYRWFNNPIIVACLFFCICTIAQTVLTFFFQYMRG